MHREHKIKLKQKNLCYRQNRLPYKVSFSVERYTCHQHLTLIQSGVQIHRRMLKLKTF